MANLDLFEKNLTNLGHQVARFATKDQANTFLCQQIGKQTVGMGGSITLQELGIYPLLAEQTQVHWHWQEGEISQANQCQVYLSSVNAAAETGELLNIDGMGNRISATLYGPAQVYFILGENKIEADFDKALWRARNIAAPKNAQRLGRETPCAQKGDRCYNCNSPQRICCSLVVQWKALLQKESFVVIVQEDLGY